jgi:N-acetyl-alpha-D-muramate 1-phosphate uridylyltransferase
MKAMILAAGRGERMRPLTDTTPKALLIVGGKPLIVWHLERLKRAGVTDIVVNHAHLGSLIEETLGNGGKLGVSIQYSRENPALETAGGIANALPLLGNEPFILVNADVFTNYDFAALRRLAESGKEGAAAHLVLVSNPEHNPKGDFFLLDGQVTPERGERLTYSGMGVYSPALFREIRRGDKAPLAPLLRAATVASTVTGEHYRGRWVDVGTPQRLKDLNEEISRHAY